MGEKEWKVTPHVMAMIVLNVVLTMSCASTEAQLDRQVPMENTTKGVIQPEKAAPTGISQQPPTLTRGTRTGVKSGKVTIHLGAFTYAKGAHIVATITNGLQHAVYAEDMKTDCSIVTLERRVGEGWQPLIDCGMERLPAVVAIMAGQEHQVKINPLSTHFGVIPGSRKPALGTGKYRLKFTYSFNPAPQGSEPESTVSQELTIAP